MTYRKSKEKSIKKAGFTLVETVVVMLLLVILLAVGAGSLIGWRHNAEYIRNNQYAKTLFSAAQSYMSKAKASGTLERDVTSIIKKYEDTDMPTDVIVGENEEELVFSKDASRLSYLKWTPDMLSTKAYLNEEDELAVLFYDIFKPYLYDKGLLDASICLEFDAEDGTVFSVCYSNHANDFTYEQDDKDKMSIYNRTESERKKILLGYYDTNLKNRAPASKERAEIQTVKLINDETLDLNFRMSNKYKLATLDFIYQIQIYDQNGTKRLEFEINTKKTVPDKDGKSLDDGKLQQNQLPSIDNDVQKLYTDVTVYGEERENGNKEEPIVLKGCKILAKVDSDYMVHLTLDAVDNESAVIFEDDPYASAEKYIDTYSIKRFGLDNYSDEAKYDKKNTNLLQIRAKVEARSDEFRVSRPGYSGYENTLISVDSSNNKEPEKYYIQNARHLFNLRFQEAELDNRKMDYILQSKSGDNSFGWADKDGIIAHGKVYNSQKKVEYSEDVKFSHASDIKVQEWTFPAIKNFAKDHTLIGRTIKNNQATVRGLLIALKYEADVEPANAPLGLFTTNEGAIQNVAFNEPTILGTWERISPEDEMQKDIFGIDYVGTVCGINKGTITDVKTIKGKVSGQNYVGGIVGGEQEDKTDPDSNDTIKYEKLTNGATVNGNSYIGGIIGSIKRNESKATIKDCSNTGGVYAWGILNNKSEKQIAQYIGGIVGYSEGASIVSCKSAPSLKVAEDAAYSELEKMMVGQFVGGIAGYNLNGTLSACYTTGGTVVGDTYVGGIVGVNQGNADNIIIEGSNKTNKANVAGKRYVGGIAGINAAIGEDGLPEEGKNENNVIQNWINKGLVTASEQYAGGITGFNTGKLVNCTVDVDTYSILGKKLLETAKRWSGEESPTGDFIGGLTGYNNGMIDTDIRKEVVSVMAGDNYVGGLIGFNDREGTLHNYDLYGGYFSGNSFVGGIAGCNVTDGLFITDDIISSPNYIEGNYFIGGLAGGNLIGTRDEKQEVISIKCNTDNFLGTIEQRDDNAGICMGGLIGLNAVMDWRKLENTQNPRMITASILNLIENTDDLYVRIEEIDKLLSESVPKNLQLKIEGGNWGNAVADKKSELNQINGYAYLGGIIGYNQTNSYLNLLGLINQTPIEAMGSLNGNKIYNEDGNVKTYSYVGGIIGKNSANTKISSCRNDGSALVRGQGMYHGALTEVNEGKIEDCVAYSTGEYGESYVGGLTGLNGVNGTIKNGGVSGTITGEDYVGGLAAENYGTIMDAKSTNPDSRIYGSGVNIGGIVGDNKTGGEITIAMSGMEYYNIGGSGINVGGVAGSNGGQILINTYNLGTGSTSVYGDDYVGGIIGRLYEGGTIATMGTSDQIVSYAGVTAANGNAGGIIGIIDTEQMNNLARLVNYGKVESQNNGNAGGITAENSSNVILNNCVNYGKVNAGNGNAGGIAAINYGTIEMCSVLGRDSDYLALQSKQNAGGISAENWGDIISSNVKYLTVSNQSKSTSSNVGGIVGENAGKVAETYVEDSGVYAYIANSNVGGIAGQNTGIIGTDDAIAKQSVICSKVGFAGEGTINGNLGGIAGINRGEITGYSFLGNKNLVANESDILGNSGSQNGYGGIVGINESQALIQECSFSGKCTAKGNQGDIANIGGIAGVNQDEGNIHNVKIGEAENIITEISAQNAYIGGIVGDNYGRVEEVNTDYDPSKVSILETCFDTKSAVSDSINVRIHTGQGQVGGIVGQNELGATVTDVVTKADWAIYATGHATDNATGGIIGYNYSGETLSNVCNTAVVDKATVLPNASNVNSVGGIVGRWENTAGESWLMEECVNYGSIYGTSRVGGMIGQWKYSSGNIKNCINYGTINAKNPKNENIGVGGFVGHLYSINENQTLRFTNCINYGDIVNKTNNNNYSLSGFIGTGNGWIKEGSINIIFDDCVNAGTVYYNSTSAGFSSMEDGLNDNISYIYCRNYGRGYNKDGKSLNRNFYGFSSKTKSVKDSFGIANVQKGGKPISTTGTIDSSYYFGEEKSSLDGTGSNNYGTGKHLYLRRETDETFTGWATDGIELEGIPYNPNTSARKYDAHEDYEKIDPIIVTYYEDKYKTEMLEAPNGIEVSFDGVEFSATWTPAKNAFKTRIQIQVFERSETKPLFTQTLDVTGNNAKISAVESWYGENRYAVINFQSISVSSKYKDSIVINWPKEFDLSQKIPVPIVHMELRRSEESYNNKEYAYILDNKNEYATFENASVKVKCADYTINIDAKVGEFIEDQKKAKPNAVTTFRVQAEVTTQAGNTLKSRENVYQTQVRSIKNLKETNLATLTASSFKGLTPASLTLGLTLEGVGNAQTYFRSELLAYDAELQTEIVLSSAAAARVSGGIPVDVLLDNIPDDYNYDKFGASWTENLSSISANWRNICDDNDNSIWEGKCLNNVGVSEDNSGKIYLSFNKVQEVNKIAIDWSGAGCEYRFKLGYYNAEVGGVTYINNGEIYNSGGGWFTTLTDEINTDLLLIEVIGVSGTNNINTIAIREVKCNDQKNTAESIYTQLRAYPWRSHNNIVYYGWTVEEGLGADEVKSRYMNENEMLNGYVAQRRSDAKYDIIFSNLLKKNQEAYMFGKQVKTKELNVKRVDTPYIEPQCEISENEYIFKWDQHLDEDDMPEYEVTLTGFKKKGDEEGVILKHYFTSEDLSASDKNVLKMDGSSWEYTYFELKVVRLGEQDNKGNTTLLGSQSTRNYQVKLRLNRITAPTYKLEDKNELIYALVWNGITDEVQLQDLLGYAVYADFRDADGEVQRIQLYDILDSTVRPERCSVDKDTMKLTVDIEAYPEILDGAELQLSIQAIARPDSEIYTDSLEGVKRKLQLPKRLKQPDISKMDLTMADTEESAIYREGQLITVTRNSFENTGFRFHITDSEMESERGSYILQAWMSKEQPGYDENGDVILPTSAVPYIDAAGNETLTMSGDNLGAGVYDLTGISSEYAGKYLIMRVRATSNNQISSKWSEYYCLKEGGSIGTLPRVQIETPQFKYDQRNTVESGNITGKDTTVDIDMKREALCWDDVGYASGYEVKLHMLEALTEDGLPEYYFLKIRKSENSATPYEIQLPGMAEDEWMLIPENDEFAVIEGADNAYAIDLCDISIDKDGNTIALPDYVSTYKGSHKEGYEVYDYEVNVPAVVLVTEKAGYISYEITLPDALFYNLHHIRTGHVLVQANPNDTTSYDESLVAEWVRVQDSTDVRFYSSIIRDINNYTEWNQGLILNSGWMIMNKLADIESEGEEINGNN